MFTISRLGCTYYLFSSRPNCAHSLGVQTPDSIGDLSHCSSNLQAPWTSPITSPPPINHPIALQLSDQRSRSSSLTINRSPPYIGINEVKPHYYHPPISPRERAHSFTASRHSMHFEPRQSFQEQAQEIHNPFMQIKPPPYSEYKRTSVLHTFSDPFGTLSTCNSTVVQHNNPPLSAGPSQSQFMLSRPKTFFSEYEIEHKILDTQHPRVQDIKRESVGELPTSSSPSCFQLSPYQSRNYQPQTNCPVTIVKEEKLFNYNSCNHAENNISIQPQIDLNSLQPTLLSDHISINSIDKDVSFEMFDNKLRIQTVPIV